MNFFHAHNCFNEQNNFLNLLFQQKFCAFVDFDVKINPIVVRSPRRTITKKTSFRLNLPKYKQGFFSKPVTPSVLKFLQGQT